MSEAIRTAVQTIIADAGVTFSAIYHGEQKGALGGNHPMDKWSCAFTKGDGREAHEEFEFYTGLGHRKPAEWKFGCRGYDGGPKPTPGTLLYEHWQADARPQAPHAADVLHSIILDSSAVGQSFQSWCDEFGYDSDSRKAEATYRACQENADKLSRIFNHQQREALAEALQDY